MLPRPPQALRHSCGRGVGGRAVLSETPPPPPADAVPCVQGRRDSLALWASSLLNRSRQARSWKKLL